MSEQKICQVCQTNFIPADADACVPCHFKGDLFEFFLLSEERSNVLGRIRELPHVTSAKVWHLGRGLFNLGVMLDDGKIIVPGIGVGVDEQVVVQPAVPPLGVAWGITVASILETEDGQAQVVATVPDTFDDDGLVEAIGAIADGSMVVAPPEPEGEELISEELARTWVTGSGQMIGNVHTPEECEGRGCPVHHPSDHAMAEWPTFYRERSIIYTPAFTERVCEHGNNHPDPDDRQRWAERGVDLMAIHDCPCGCCLVV